jgi:hypothetical protein
VRLVPGRASAHARSVVRVVCLLALAVAALGASGCMRYGLYGRAYGTSRYSSSTQVIAPAYATGPTTITTSTTYPYGYGYGYAPTYGTGGPTYGSGPYGTTYSGYDTSGYGYGVTSAYGTPAGYGSAPTTSTMGGPTGSYAPYVPPSTSVTVIVAPR